MKRNKKKTVYPQDNGETIYSMSSLYGRTPEEQEEYDKKRKSKIDATGRERWAMMQAAFAVYGPLLLICLLGFGLTGLLMYFFLK